MARPGESGFAALLRGHRSAAAVSQELLAERAKMSASAISALERGARQAPYRETVALLAEALGLDQPQRVELERAAEAGRDRKNRTNADDLTPNNLPTPLSSFIGRSSELRAVGELLGKNRLITLTGAAGIGKTRIALEAAAAYGSMTSKRVAFVDLTPVTDPTFVTGKIAAVMKIALGENSAQLEALTAGVGTQTLLLVIDNCEHVLAQAAEVIQTLLQRCPRLTIMSTSRERLGVAGEIVYRLLPLSLPAGTPASIEDARQFSAIDLFIERVLEADPQFAFSNERLGTVVDIGRQLDGIALAIELAAARLPFFGLSELSRRLQGRLDVLARGGPSPDRQRTLTAAIAWSCELLERSELQLLCQLSIFANGWTLSAAVRVCEGTEKSDDRIVSEIIRLVEKSLVSVENGRNPTRYRLLEATRTYVRSLVPESELQTLARRHAEWCASMVERWLDLQFSAPRLTWVHEIEQEADNVRAAIAWASAVTDDVIIGARLAVGPSAVSDRSLARRMLSRLDETQEPEIAGFLWWRIGGTHLGAEKIDCAKRAITLFERAHNRRMVGVCHSVVALALAQMGEYDRAHEASLLSIAIAESVGNDVTLAYSFTDLSDICHMQGNVPGQRAALTRALTLAASFADDWLVSRLRSSLADLEFAAGDARLAAEIGDDVLISARRMSSLRDQMTALCRIARFQFALGDFASAAEAAREALELGRGREETITVAALSQLAAIAANSGKAARATRLLGYVDAWRQRNGYVCGAAEEHERTSLLSLLRDGLSDEAIELLSTEGSGLSEDKAIAEALQPTV